MLRDLISWPNGGWLLVGLVVLAALIWLCVLVSQDRKNAREWNEQQQRLSEERASDLANDCQWIALTEEMVKNLKPFYGEPDTD